MSDHASHLAAATRIHHINTCPCLDRRHSRSFSDHLPVFCDHLPVLFQQSAQLLNVPAVFFYHIANKMFCFCQLSTGLTIFIEMHIHSVCTNTGIYYSQHNHAHLMQSYIEENHTRSHKQHRATSCIHKQHRATQWVHKQHRAT